MLDDDSVDPEQTHILADQLGNLPLALAQAASFIRHNSLTIRKYIQLLERSDHDLVDLLSQPFEDGSRDSSVPNAVAATWMISFKQIQQLYAFASQLLSLISFFNWQDIPQEFLASYQERGAGIGASEAQETLYIPQGTVELEKALGVIKAFSFISESEVENSFNMHRLTQLVMRKWLIVQPKGGRWQSLALELLLECFPTGQYEHWTVCTRYLPHALSVLTHAGNDTEQDAIARAALQHNVALFMLYQGKWDVAEKFQSPAAEIHKRVLGTEHPNTLTSMANLALTFWSQGRWKEAEELGVQVIETRKRVLGAEHPDTLTSINNLALTYMHQGRLKEAEELGVEVIETEKRVLGTEHPDTLTSMDNLALTYMHQGRLKEAEALSVQVIEMRKRVLGAEHPNTLTSMNNLAYTWKGQDRGEEAVALMKECLQLRERVLGTEHPSTSASRTTLRTWEMENLESESSGI
jgi:tetratricopeptide (TPR) repeat protein